MEQLEGPENTPFGTGMEQTGGGDHLAGPGTGEISELGFDSERHAVPAAKIEVEIDHLLSGVRHRMFGVGQTDHRQMPLDLIAVAPFKCPQGRAGRVAEGTGRVVEEESLDLRHGAKTSQSRAPASRLHSG